METEKNDRYPEGHFLNLWMAIGMVLFSGLGIPLSVVTKNYGLIGIGPAIGVAFGLSVGQAVENRYKKENRLRPLTEAEKRRKKAAVIAWLAIFMLGLLIFLFLYLSRS